MEQVTSMKVTVMVSDPLRVWQKIMFFTFFFNFDDFGLNNGKPVKSELQPF